jgi:branched-chain amino acid transport system permease protein
VVWTLFGAGPWLGAPIAALLLATLGVVVYFGLIRHIMKGPMLAQILGTFGLALLLRYSVFWWFGANFLSLPENLVGGTFELWACGSRPRACWPASSRSGDAGLHLLLTRTSSARRCWRSPRIRTAAQLMGIRPDTHAGARLGDCGGRNGSCRRADRDLLLHRADGRRDAWPCRLRGRCRSAASAACPARWYAGLLIGVIESLSAYLIGAVYKDIVVYSLFLALPLVPAARPDGQVLMGKT